jgi:hypothetical protein
VKELEKNVYISQLIFIIESEMQKNFAVREEGVCLNEVQKRKLDLDYD